MHYAARKMGVLWKLPGYVMGPNSGFIMTDILKLAAIMHANRRYQAFELIFAYPAPPLSDWGALVQAIMVKVPNVVVNLSCLDNIGRGDLSIGWLALDRARVKTVQAIELFA